MSSLAAAVLINLISDLIFLLLLQVVIRTRDGSKGQLRRLGMWSLPVLPLAGAFIGIYWAALKGGHPGLIVTMSVGTALCVALVPSLLVLSFRRSGLFGVRRQQENGDWASPALLQRARSKFYLLGTGAAKFTESSNFESEIRRLVRAKADIKFLVADPGSDAHREAARLAGQMDVDQYSVRVRESLRRMIKLAEQTNNGLEVRQYGDGSRFLRMVLVDDDIFLSYNVYGEPGPGGNGPAWRVKRRRKQPIESFYWGFERYFLAEWNRATPVTLSGLESADSARGPE